MEDKIVFSCPEHGEFTCRASSLYRKCGCPVHSGILKTEFQFIKELNDKYGNKYTIHNYKGTHSVIDIICNKCGNNFKKEARQLHHDWLKRKYAKTNNINLFTIKFCKINKLKIIMKDFLTKIK